MSSKFESDKTIYLQDISKTGYIRKQTKHGIYVQFESNGGLYFYSFSEIKTNQTFKEIEQDFSNFSLETSYKKERKSIQELLDIQEQQQDKIIVEEHPIQSIIPQNETYLPSSKGDTIYAWPDKWKLSIKTKPINSGYSKSIETFCKDAHSMICKKMKNTKKTIESRFFTSPRFSSTKEYGFCFYGDFVGFCMDSDDQHVFMKFSGDNFNDMNVIEMVGETIQCTCGMISLQNSLPEIIVQFVCKKFIGVNNQIYIVFDSARIIYEKQTTSKEKPIYSLINILSMMVGDKMKFVYNDMRLIGLNLKDTDFHKYTQELDELRVEAYFFTQLEQSMARIVGTCRNIDENALSYYSIFQSYVSDALKSIK